MACFSPAVLYLQLLCFPGVLWSGALAEFLKNLTEGAIDPFVWTDCKFGFFLMYFGFNYSSALLIVLSIEKFIALYFPLKSKSLCTVSMARRVSLVTAVIFVAFDSQFLVFGKVLSDQYVSLRLRVQNAVSPQPCVGKFRISLVLLNFLHCNFRF